MASEWPCVDRVRRTCGQRRQERSLSGRRRTRRPRMGKSYKRRNSICVQFSMHRIEMIESPAWQALSLSARRLLDRLEIELAHHGGNDNGKLPATYQDFISYGIGTDQIAPAIREVEALGFVRVTERGRGGNAEYRKPNLFY